MSNTNSSESLLFIGYTGSSNGGDPEQHLDTLDTEEGLSEYQHEFYLQQFQAEQERLHYEALGQLDPKEDEEVGNEEPVEFEESDEEDVSEELDLYADEDPEFVLRPPTLDEAERAYERSLIGHEPDPIMTPAAMSLVMEANKPDEEMDWEVITKLFNEVFDCDDTLEDVKLFMRDVGHDQEANKRAGLLLWCSLVVKQRTNWV